ncbi:cytochrome PufQ [Meridianimarinicoccus aquatilis]|uniref:Protein pufQ n=1 Tax=Meridianimarinicoccus aquatilis TaxID=2552766 RepID=A0A4V3BC26_9RHOB|nr:cytochrome PufQ [Fluviibacterium aquatile]QIE42564.1 protein pufQ [Rhodobacteraceae bacterium SC52]TDL89179.1 protein pufQ [Fluviibacterium aquatile]
MTDFTSSETHTRRPMRRGAEFHLYFALIFVLALPFSTGGWVLDVIARRTLNLHGPLARAWAEADRITPLIFSA